MERDPNLQELEKKLEEIKDKHKIELSTKKSSSLQGLDIVAEMAAGVFVGVIIGLIFDNLFDSKPLFLVICIILSVIAAFRSIWKKYIINPK